MQTNIINWNELQDPFDLEIWNKLVSQFWIDTKIPLSNDLKSWSEMTEAEKLTTKKVFVGLTALDSIQSLVGAPTLQKHALTDHEQHALNNIAFMESVHAKSYSSIFSTLCSDKEIDEMYAWGDANTALQTKGRMIEEAYHSGDIHKIRIASTLLESFLFYSGFFWPLYLSGRKKLTNTSDLIKLIIKDECLVADHELLTPDGWKPIAEITEEDRVAQYLEDGTKIEFVNPVKISSHEAPYIWEFVSAEGHIRQFVSGNHRMYTVDSEDRGKITRADSYVPSKGDYFVGYGDERYPAERVVKTKGEGRTMYGVEVPSGLLLTRNQGSVTVTGNSVHGLYIGYKHKQAQKPLSPEVREEYKQFTHDLMQELFDNEMVYTRELYDELNLTSEVATFLKYNANKALENLGYEHIYKPEDTRVMPSVMAVLSPGGDNHDFFSGAGSSYQVAKKVNLSDADFDF